MKKEHAWLAKAPAGSGKMKKRLKSQLQMRD